MLYVYVTPASLAAAIAAGRSDVPVPVTLTYLSDASPLLSSTAPRSAGAAALPADFTVVSGALKLQVAGTSTGPLPCDACVARLTLPISGTPTDTYSYLCAHVVGGQPYFDAAVVAAGSASSTPSGGVVECSVSQAGTYVVARVLRATSGAPQQGSTEQQASTTAGNQGAAAGAVNVPAIVGGVVGGVVGAVLVAAVALFVIKRR